MSERFTPYTNKVEAIGEPLYGRSPELERHEFVDLYHVAGFVPGSPDQEPVITLEPGTQISTGRGVYFTEGRPQLRYAGGERNLHRWDRDFVVVFKFTADIHSKDGWFRSNNDPRRPSFWHSNGQTLYFANQYNEELIDGVECHVYSERL